MYYVGHGSHKTVLSFLFIQLAVEPAWCPNLKCLRIFRHLNSLQIEIIINVVVKLKISVDFSLRCGLAIKKCHFLFSTITLVPLGHILYPDMTTLRSGTCYRKSVCRLSISFFTLFICLQHFVPYSNPLTSVQNPSVDG